MLRVTQAAAGEPIESDEVKTLLRIDHTALDAVLPMLITASREVVERQTAYALVEATYEWTPEDPTSTQLPLLPCEVTSAAGVYPIVLVTRPGPTPAALKIVIVMLVGALLAHPEASAEKVLSDNPALANMLFPFRKVLP